MLRTTLLSTLLVACAGCATITMGTTQSVSINAPQGAVCILSSSSIGKRTITAPATITLEKGTDNVAVSCTKRCYQDGAGVIESSVEPMTAGNILVGGVIGLGVDAVSGAINKYENHVTIPMHPIKGCGAPPKAAK